MGRPINGTSDHDQTSANFCSHLGHAANDLAIKRFSIEPTLTSDDYVGLFHLVEQAKLIGYQVKATHDCGPQRNQAASEPACSPGANHAFDINVKIVAIPLG